MYAKIAKGNDLYYVKDVSECRTEDAKIAFRELEKTNSGMAGVRDTYAAWISEQDYKKAMETSDKSFEQFGVSSPERPAATEDIKKPVERLLGHFISPPVENTGDAIQSMIDAGEVGEEAAEALKIEPETPKVDPVAAKMDEIQARNYEDATANIKHMPKDFQDAVAENVEATKKMFGAEDGPPRVVIKGSTSVPNWKKLPLYSKVGLNNDAILVKMIDGALWIQGQQIYIRNDEQAEAALLSYETKHITVDVTLNF